MPVTNPPGTSARVEDLLPAVCSIWERHVNSSLPLPPQWRSFDSRQLKEFCVGLLENPTTHPWQKALSTCDSRKALSVAGSLFLFRKALPAEWSEAEMCQAHRAAFIPECRPARDDLPVGYIDHVRRITAGLFPEGWDRSYTSKCWSSTPSVSSCTGSPRSKGGARALKPDRESFLRRTTGREWFEVDNEVRYQVVATGGKGRGVTIASMDLRLLHPLHVTMYDQLCTFPWMLRGEAKSGRFRRFTRKPGEVFVSGDYESASDHLRVEVADAIIDVMQSSSYKVPSTIWEAARSFLRSKIRYPDLEVPLQSEGQLMGNLLCFPLLCLQNYLAFRWKFSEEVPVKINGDDIVFRSTRAEYESWASFVGSAGLRLSRGKTLVHDKYFSLNSSFFWSRPFKAPRPVPVTRVACFGKPFEDWGSLGGSYRSLTRGFSGEAKLAAEVLFLKHFRGKILQAGRSVRRGLSIPASTVALQRSGLWRRECWYFQSVPEETDSLPESPCRLKWGAVPPGWKRVPANSVRLSGKVSFIREGDQPPTSSVCSRQAAVDEIQKCFWSQLTSKTWVESPSRGALLADYKDEVLRTSRESLFRSWKDGYTRISLCGGKRVARRSPLWGADKSSSYSVRFWKERCRVTRDAADNWSTKKRGPLVWAPVMDDDVEELKETNSVSDLVEYEGGFRAMQGNQPFHAFPPPEFYPDARFGLGYR